MRVFAPSCRSSLVALTIGRIPIDEHRQSGYRGPNVSAASALAPRPLHHRTRARDQSSSCRYRSRSARAPGRWQAVPLNYPWIRSVWICAMIELRHVLGHDDEALHMLLGEFDMLHLLGSGCGGMKRESARSAENNTASDPQRLAAPYPLRISDMAWVSILTLPLASQNFGLDMTEVHRAQCSTPMLSQILRQDRNCGGITQSFFRMFHLRCSRFGCWSCANEPPARWPCHQRFFRPWVMIRFIDALELQ